MAAALSRGSGESVHGFVYGLRWAASGLLRIALWWWLPRSRSASAGCFRAVAGIWAAVDVCGRNLDECYLDGYLLGRLQSIISWLNLEDITA
ncbi:hypothetical protein AKJ16_DCAP04158 [Drosera capensis]